MIQTARCRYLRGLSLGVACIAVALTGCSSDAEDPVQQQRDRVETRLGASFSADQTACIMTAIDAPTIEALDGTADLGADSEAMLVYTVAVRACVDQAAPATTTSAGDTTTTSEG